MMPNLIIAGAPKCGTTSLFTWLSDHPAVCAPVKEEIRYFIDPGYPLFNRSANYHAHGLHGYAEYFASCAHSNASVVLEATPDYMYQSTALEGIAKIRPMPIVLFLLRKPSARLYSFFKFAQNNMAVLDQKYTFAQFVKTIKDDPLAFPNDAIMQNAFEQGKYYEYLKKWAAAYDRDKIKIVLFENMIEDPRKFVAAISDALSIDSSYWNDYPFARKNESYVVRYQFIQAMMRNIRKYVPPFLKKEWMKKLYFWSNTRRMDAIAEDEKAVMASLDAEYSRYNGHLARLFSIDLSIWNK